MQERTRFKLNKGDVAVTFSPGLQNIAVREVAEPRTLDQLPNTVKKGRKPKRLVAEIEFYDPALDPSPELPSFEGWARLEVRYKRGDVKRAGGYKKLRLYYYWDGQWHAFKKKHDFHIVPNNPKKPWAGGKGVVYLDNWLDPPIGWDA